MSTALRVLLVEDSEADALLEIDALREGGYEPEVERVETAPQMEAALEREPWDVVICDYVLPRFGGLEALQLLHEKGIDLPFIIVSGQINEETAVRAMRAGAHDYVLKDNLGRLAPAVERELHEARERKMRRETEKALEAERLRLRAVLEAFPIGVFLADASGRIVNANQMVTHIWGPDVPRPSGISDYGIYRGWRVSTGERIQAEEWGLARALLKGETTLGEMINIERPDGGRKTILNSAAPIRDPGGHIVGAVVTMQDVTEFQQLRKDLERSLERARRESQRVEALANISEAGISTLDLREMMERFARLIVEAMGANSGHIMLIDPESSESEIQYACNGPSDPEPLNGFPGVILGQKRTVYIADAKKDSRLTSPAFRGHGIKSLLGTPLVAHSQILGTVYVDTQEERHFSAEDRRLLEAMAARVTSALENARLYEALVHSRNELEEALGRERHFSLLLQRALLPEIPDIIAGYRVAAEYAPMYASREIGGDFYDVHEVGGLRAGIQIGDVSGKGLEATALAAATRSTIHAFVHETSSAADALTRANAVIAARHSVFDAFITVFLIQMDLRTGDIDYASAGHPPAAVCRNNGEVEFLQIGQMPLGIQQAQQYYQNSLCLEPGEKLALYTDGIMEAYRDDYEMFGLEGIQKALQKSMRLPAHGIAKELIQAATEWAEGKLTDDAAIVVIERLKRP